MCLISAFARGFFSTSPFATLYRCHIISCSNASSSQAAEVCEHMKIVNCSEFVWCYLRTSSWSPRCQPKQQQHQQWKSQVLESGICWSLNIQEGWKYTSNIWESSVRRECLAREKRQEVTRYSKWEFTSLFSLLFYVLPFPSNCFLLLHEDIPPKTSPTKPAAASSAPNFLCSFLSISLDRLA